MLVKQSFAEWCGWFGLAALLIAYALVSFSFLQARSRSYQLLNLVGAAGIILVSLEKKVRPVVALNSVWGAIALYSLYALFG